MSALSVSDLHVRRGALDVLRGVTFSVEPGEICALMGASGAGKSTILRTVAALQPFDSGKISLGDVSLVPGAVPAESKLKALRARVGMVFQAHALFDHLSVLDNITLAPIHALRQSRVTAERTAHELLASLGISARAEAFPRQLSGGEAQRAAIARALAVEPKLLLMDEPTSALDPSRRGALGETLRSLAKDGRSLLIATHDADFARTFADRVITLADGLVVA